MTPATLANWAQKDHQTCSSISLTQQRRMTFQILLSNNSNLSMAIPAHLRKAKTSSQALSQSQTTILSSQWFIKAFAKISTLQKKVKTLRQLWTRDTLKWCKWAPFPTNLRSNNSQVCSLHFKTCHTSKNMFHSQSKLRESYSMIYGVDQLWSTHLLVRTQLMTLLNCSMIWVTLTTTQRVWI